MAGNKPAYAGGLNAATLDELAVHYTTLRSVQAYALDGYGEAQCTAAWQAIMLTYPELLAAARVGLKAKRESD